MFLMRPPKFQKCFEFLDFIIQMKFFPILKVEKYFVLLIQLLKSEN